MIVDAEEEDKDEGCQEAAHWEPEEDAQVDLICLIRCSENSVGVLIIAHFNRNIR